MLKKSIEIGFRENHLANWWSIGIEIRKHTTGGMVEVTLPGAITLRLLILTPFPSDPPISPGSKWWWFGLKIRCYRLLNIEIGLPLWWDPKRS